MTKDELDDLPHRRDLGKSDAIDAAAAGGLAAAPGLADLLLQGSGILVAASGGLLMNLINRYTVKQTQWLVEELSVRVRRLEASGRLDPERLERLEEMWVFPALAANAVSSPEKTEFYADVLAGVVSIDAPNSLDVESFIATLQNLSVQEIDLARRIHDAWEMNENGERSSGVRPWAGEDTEYYVKRLEGAGLVVPRMRTGPPGAGVRSETFDPTPTLGRLVLLLRSGRGDPPE